MRVVVVGATGNVGTSLLRSLADDPEVESVLGLARRAPGMGFPKTQWGKVDVSRATDLADRFDGADAVVHLAWLIQPGRDLETLYATNVEGSRRVFQAAADAGVPALVYASSVGAYAPGPKDRAVDESWPTTGLETSTYARHKAEVERILDRIEEEAPALRSVRLRPGLIFKRDAASEIRRLRAGAAVSWRLRLQPSEPGWVDMALNVPIMDCSRAREELGWRPRRTSVEALRELLEGIRDGAGIDTPPLAAGTGGPLRIRELLTGVGSR